MCLLLTVCGKFKEIISLFSPARTSPLSQLVLAMTDDKCLHALLNNHLRMP